jgi:hypothetical protein
MSYVTNDPATKIRSVTVALPAVAATSGLGVSQFVGTPDDNKKRRLTGIYTTYQTKFFRVHIRVAGREVMVFDPSMIAPAARFLQVDQDYGATLQFEYALESPNPGGPAIVVNTDQIVFLYECTPDFSQ